MARDLVAAGRWRGRGWALATLAIIGSACGGASPSRDPVPRVPEPPTETAAPENAPTENAPATLTVGIAYGTWGLGDRGFNDAAQEGLARATARLEADEAWEVEVTTVEPEGGEPAWDGILEDLCGHDLVLAIGVDYEAAASAVGPACPETRFAVIDSVRAQEPNVASAVFALHEGSFLAGAAAALTSDTGTVGFLGQERSRVDAYEAGFVAGVAAARPGVRVEVDYLQREPGLPTSPPAVVRRRADDMYRSGIDVVYNLTGTLEPAAAALEARDVLGGDRWVIGANVDEYGFLGPGARDVVLTSMLLRVDVVVDETVEAFTRHHLYPQPAYFGLARRGAELSPSGDFLSDEAIRMVAGLRRRVIRGDIVVPWEPQ